MSGELATANRHSVKIPVRLGLELMAAACLLLALAANCASPDQGAARWPTAEWPTATPEEQSMDSARLQQMMDIIDDNGFAYDAVLVTRRGQIVFEEYRNGYDRDTRHHLQSVTKSFSSVLVGVAVQEGFLEGVHQRMVDLFAGYEIANLDARKEQITLEHLLTMSDGLDWHELDYPYTDARNTLGQMWVSSDAIQHVLDRPMVREPGEAWAYNSGTSILLGGILEQATGRDVLAFARDYLFRPLGIEDVVWSRTTGNHYHTDGGLYLTPRDMARLGYLMLRDGVWEGRMIVPSDWVARSTQAHYQTGTGYGYGYQWWTLDRGVYAARGHYEQTIYVIPEADMVVVFTGEIPDNVIPPTDGLLYRYILPACTDLPQQASSHTFASHGFRLVYPAGFTVAEMPLPGHDGVSDEAGIVQFRFPSYPLELLQVLWVQEEPGVALDAYLSDFLDAAREQGDARIAVGESANAAQSGHAAVHVPLDLEQQGLRLKGTAVAWYCTEGRRVYIVFYGTSPEVSDGDLAARLEEHLRALECHAPD